MESYTITEADVAKVNEERGYRTATANEVREGDEFPMIVVRENEDGTVNGQVFLDGPDTLWVTNVDLHAGEVPQANSEPLAPAAQDDVTDEVPQANSKPLAPAAQDDVTDGDFQSTPA